MDRAADLRKDYERLGEILADAKGSGAAAIARERRQIGELLEVLERPTTEVPLVDQLAERRRTKTSPARSASRRSKSG